MPIIKGSKETVRKALQAVDWTMVDATADAEIARQIAEDPDTAPDQAPELDVAAIRRRAGMSQGEFAKTFHFSVRTLQEWECGAKQPSGPARVLLRVIDRRPDAVREALEKPSAS